MANTWNRHGAEEQIKDCALRAIALTRLLADERPIGNEGAQVLMMAFHGSVSFDSDGEMTFESGDGEGPAKDLRFCDLAAYSIKEHPWQQLHGFDWKTRNKIEEMAFDLRAPLAQRDVDRERLRAALEPHFKKAVAAANLDLSLLESGAAGGDSDALF